MKKYTLHRFTLIICALIFYVSTPISIVVAKENTKTTYDLFELFAHVFETVNNDYIEKPNEEELIHAAINGMLNSLDPYSNYLSEKDFSDMQIDTKGAFGGLGLEVTLHENGLVQVISPIDDTPASKAGIMAGDFITHIDGEEVFGMSLGEAVGKMRGYINTRINLTIYRDYIKEVINFEIIRGVIQITPVKSEIIDNIGYIRISTFSEITNSTLTKAIHSMQKELSGKIIGYILDLRNNPGGLLDEAIKVSDSFLNEGEIVSTRDRDNSNITSYYAKKGDETNRRPIVVIINKGSASASEIVAGALKDNNRATIIGTKSYGKGSVQTVMPLGRGNGAMKLTTSHYYTPSGKSIQTIGIKPHYEIEREEAKELSEKNQIEENLNKSLYNKNDNQIKFAIKLITARSIRKYDY
jgi:carboxyl-terminal processing protease